MYCEERFAFFQRKYLRNAGRLKRVMSTHDSTSCEDMTQQSLSLTVLNWQEKMLDGEVCLLKDSPFRILRVSIPRQCCFYTATLCEILFESFPTVDGAVAPATVVGGGMEGMI